MGSFTRTTRHIPRVPRVVTGMPTTTSPTAPGSTTTTAPDVSSALAPDVASTITSTIVPTATSTMVDDATPGPPLLELPSSLPSPAEQAERLIELGVAELAGLPHDEVRAAAARAGASGLLVVAPSLAPVSALAHLLRRGDREGFVVSDMTDVDSFTPIAGVEIPASPVYVIAPPDRGDDLANWSPDEALPELEHRGRSPLTLAEGVHWLLQVPEALERNHCFMTIGSRLRKPDGRLDTRTPALWISNGTGRDGRERRDAPKVGWCWAGNRHTWLGFASTTSRREA
jgi:hypothetical protein